MTRKTLLLTVGAALALGVAPSLPAAAQMTAAEAARLGRDLTPLGAERAGNEDGTVPAWDGGITEPPAGYKPGDHHPNPFADDELLFTITQENMAQYADKLTPGHLAMLRHYDTYKMKVYPSRRSAGYPQHIYDATKREATAARLVGRGGAISGAVMGIPFPIPKSGVEVVWNHLTRYRGEMASRTISQAAVTSGGSYTEVVFEEEFHLVYTEEWPSDRSLYFRQEVVLPARLAGGILLVQETFNEPKKPRRALLSPPGQPRERLAPDATYDGRGTATDGMRTSDQFDMFNGAPDRYDWTLVGKKEIYVPYNNYDLHSDQLKHKDILTPLHINPEHLRYELHRVWVVDANLKPGTRHIYKRRTLYVDEDSWQILLVDQYDNRDQLWRVSEGFVINYYDVPMLWTTLEVHTDLQARRYLAVGLNNEHRMHAFPSQFLCPQGTHPCKVNGVPACCKD